MTPRAFPGCFPCGNTAVGAAQGCGGWARNPGNVLWPGLQPSPCQAELFHSPMQLYFRNFFSELVLLLLILLKHSHGIFLIVPALGPCCPGMIQAPCPVELHGGLSLGMANPAWFDGFVVDIEFPELQLSQIPQSIPLWISPPCPWDFNFPGGLFFIFSHQDFGSLWLASISAPTHVLIPAPILAPSLLPSLFPSLLPSLFHLCSHLCSHPCSHPCSISVPISVLSLLLSLGRSIQHQPWVPFPLLSLFLGMCCKE